MQSIIVPEHVADRIAKHLNKLARKARVTFERVPGVTYLGAEDDGRVPCARFTLSALPAQDSASTWELVARIEHTPAGNIVSAFPGECPSALWRTSKPHCDHCNTTRARRDTFVLRAPDGALRSIGCNCLADFLVGDPAELVARAELAAFAAEPCDDPEYRRGGGGWEPSTQAYLCFVCAAVRVEGFRKASEAGGSTRSTVQFSMGMPPKDDTRSRALWESLQPKAEDREFAGRLVDWKPEGRSDYEHNLRIALALPSVGRTAGILASAPSAYARAMGEELGRPKKTGPVSEHFGEVGKRGFLLLRLMRVTDVESAYGTVSFLTFEDMAGRSFLWKASGTCPGQGAVGDVFTGKATIKKHDEYKGRKQTVLSRFAWEECKAPEAESAAA